MQPYDLNLSGEVILRKDQKGINSDYYARLELYIRSPDKKPKKATVTVPISQDHYLSLQQQIEKTEAGDLKLILESTNLEFKVKDLDID